MRPGGELRSRIGLRANGFTSLHGHRTVTGRVVDPVKGAGEHRGRIGVRECEGSRVGAEDGRGGRPSGDLRSRKGLGAGRGGRPAAVNLALDESCADLHVLFRVVLDQRVLVDASVSGGGESANQEVLLDCVVVVVLCCVLIDLVTVVAVTSGLAGGGWILAAVVVVNGATPILFRASHARRPVLSLVQSDTGRRVQIRVSRRSGVA